MSRGKMADILLTQPSLGITYLAACPITKLFLCSSSNKLASMA
jgi:hypothetical protein